MSRQSRLLVNGKGDDEMIPGAVHRSGIYLTGEENPGTYQLETVDEGCAISHRLKWGPFPPNEVSRIAQHVRKGGRRKGRCRVNQFNCKSWEI